MHIYFSGIGGSGLSALAHLALDCGYTVSGSDVSNNDSVEKLKQRGVKITFEQNLEEIEETHNIQKIDWIVISSALKLDHQHIAFAKKNQIRLTKRDKLINYILKEKNLKMLAVAGTHGKTTTTGMLVWLFKQLEIKVSYIIGAEIGYGKSGEYQKSSEYFIYECDEFDRNMLNYNPEYSLIASLDYDHGDTYPSVDNYLRAFDKFVNQNNQSVLAYEDVYKKLKNQQKIQKSSEESLFDIQLPGLHNRKNANLVAHLAVDVLGFDKNRVIDILSNFPGTGRRMEKLHTNLYSDYGHHPVEILATLQTARELLQPDKKLALFYQPHQNIRQHQIEVQEGYKSCFNLADQVFWFPTFLSRENNLPVLTPVNLLQIAGHSNNPKFKVVDFDYNTVKIIESLLEENYLVLCMGAGSIDSWFRKNII